MKRLLMIVLIGLIGIAIAEEAKEFTLHDFDALRIDGVMLEMSQFKGKKVMVVNVASKCGFTAQYAQLQELYHEYSDENFEIIAFPANNFKNQEPGSDIDIMLFAEENFGVTFTMMSKISVKGDDIHPIYAWLTDPDADGKIDNEVQWNFQKFLIDENGKIAMVKGTKVNPMDDEIVNWIKDKDNSGVAEE